MTEECKYCDKEFDKEKRKLQHELKEHEDEMSSHDRDGKKRKLSKLNEKNRNKKHKRKKKLKYGGIGLILIIALVAGGYQLTQYADSLQPEQNSDKGIGTPIHWHANYQLTVCGENRILQGGPTEAHTHGQSQFHLEGVRKSEEQASLDGIVDSLGGKLENNSIMGQSTCNGEPAELTVKANGNELENPLSYIPRDGDNIVIRLE